MIKPLKLTYFEWCMCLLLCMYLYLYIDIKFHLVFELYIFSKFLYNYFANGIHTAGFFMFSPAVWFLAGILSSFIFNFTSDLFGFPGGSEVKASACNVGDLGSIPGSGRSPGEGNGNPLQYSCLKNPMDGGAWWATVHRVAKSQTQLSDFTFFHFQICLGLHLLFGLALFSTYFYVLFSFLSCLILVSGSGDKESVCSAGDIGVIPGSG